ncbi:hypothetical protein C943_04589 [Mariniradius saccharolyticus AK6]|uniref:Uncharacterized protein n=1 Tax=Mariniradius saccharolyticus AK6 TaxID=1239962 RepID=M7X8I5_9BACT|nr:hypothetical protein C943_04589 [Mariniradius saccharolyticus AK6]
MREIQIQFTRVDGHREGDVQEFFLQKFKLIARKMWISF